MMVARFMLRPGRMGWNFPPRNRHARVGGHPNSLFKLDSRLRGRDDEGWGLFSHLAQALGIGDEDRIKVLIFLERQCQIFHLFG